MDKCSRGGGGRLFYSHYPKHLLLFFSHPSNPFFPISCTCTPSHLLKAQRATTDRPIEGGKSLFLEPIHRLRYITGGGATFFFFSARQRCNFTNCILQQKRRPRCRCRQPVENLVPSAAIPPARERLHATRSIISPPFSIPLLVHLDIE